MRRPRFDAVIFDLDGTLLDTAPDVTAALQQTFAEEGLPTLSDERARALIGPPLVASLLAEGLPEARAHQAVARYRAIFAAIREPRTRPFPGALHALGRLHRAGVLMAVATSKAAESAVPLLVSHRLVALFHSVHCAVDGNRDPDKRELIRTAAGRLRAERSDVRTVAMVGDKTYDVLGARAAGVVAVHADWGYGPGEGAGAEYGAHDWNALSDLVLAGDDHGPVSP